MSDEYDNIIKLWNESADQYNQWDALSEEEKVDFAIAQTREACMEAKSEIRNKNAKR